MHTYLGTLQSAQSGERPLTVTLQFDRDRVRMWSDRRRIGSWDANDVTIERQTIFRFRITIDDEHYIFSPEDPSGFAASVDLEIDLTDREQARFGLAERLRQVAETG